MTDREYIKSTDNFDETDLKGVDDSGADHEPSGDSSPVQSPPEFEDASQADDGTVPKSAIDLAGSVLSQIPNSDRHKHAVHHGVQLLGMIIDSVCDQCIDLDA